jgi:hypothetical protein
MDPLFSDLGRSIFCNRSAGASNYLSKVPSVSLADAYPIQTAVPQGHIPSISTVGRKQTSKTSEFTITVKKVKCLYRYLCMHGNI